MSQDAIVTASKTPCFTLQHTDGSARAGLLNGNPTPAPILYTFRGLPFSMTPDLLDDLGPAAQSLHLDASQFLEHPSPALVRKHGGGAHGFLGLQGRLLVASARDPVQYSVQRWKNRVSDSVRVVTHSGHQDLGLDRYLEVIAAMQPDFWLALPDEVPAQASHRRTVKSVDRSLQWLDRCLAAQAEGTPHSGLLAAVQGGGLAHERRRSAAECARREGVAGFALNGLGTGESPAERLQLMHAAAAELPAGLPRFLLAGAEQPEDALDAIEAGVDLVDGSHALRAALAGCALLLRACDADSAEADSAHGAGCPPGAAEPGGRLPAADDHASVPSTAAHAARPGSEPADSAVDLAGYLASEAGCDGSEAVSLPAELEACSSSAVAKSAEQQQQQQQQQQPGRSGQGLGRGKSRPRSALPAEPGTPAGLYETAVRTRRGWGTDAITMNLWSPQFREDARPLSAGCSCYACGRHSRAYVHHLLKTGEMLAQVLLEVHNTHNYSEFFADARAAIREGRFQEHRAAFVRRRGLPCIIDGCKGAIGSSDSTLH